MYNSQNPDFEGDESTSNVILSIEHRSHISDIIGEDLAILVHYGNGYIMTNYSRHPSVRNHSCDSTSNLVHLLIVVNIRLHINFGLGQGRGLRSAC